MGDQPLRGSRLVREPFDPERWRPRFPGLSRRIEGRPAVFFDGPAGSQVPRGVVDAVATYLTETNANSGGVFATGAESDALLRRAHRAVADFLGSDDPDLVIFGPNMTTLTLALAHAMSRDWRSGDEVLVTRLEHDANFTPWVEAAREAGAIARWVRIRRTDCTLDLEDLRSKLSDRTRLVAVSAASNAVGTIPPLGRIVTLAHDAGARVFVDAVHRAPHRLIDVAAWDCDFLVCSAYKFFGPHVGMLWGKRELLERLPVRQLRPAPRDLPGRWMTGTQNHEGIAGTLAAIEYLAGIGRAHEPEASDRRAAIVSAFETIGEYERSLSARTIAALSELPDVRVWGIADPSRLDERVPTFSITHRRHSPLEIARHLAQRGIFVWHGNFYALPLTEALELEPDGLVRIGLLHYNTVGEIDRLGSSLAEL
jgi:cysteine desulfurase family protein (TIGR01976 family)